MALILLIRLPDSVVTLFFTDQEVPGSIFSSVNLVLPSRELFYTSYGLEVFVPFTHVPCRALLTEDHDKISNCVPVPVCSS